MGGGGGRGKKQARDFFAGLDGLCVWGGLVWVAACR